MSTRARKTWGAGALVALAAAFLALTIVVTFALRGARLDLTASRLYTIAPGTERIVGSLTEPVNLYFFLSDEASRSTRCQPRPVSRSRGFPGRRTGSSRATTPPTPRSRSTGSTPGSTRSASSSPPAAGRTTGSSTR